MTKTSFVSSKIEGTSEHGDHSKDIKEHVGCKYYLESCSRVSNAMNSIIRKNLVVKEGCAWKILCGTVDRELSFVVWTTGGKECILAMPVCLTLTIRLLVR